MTMKKGCMRVGILMLVFATLTGCQKDQDAKEPQYVETLAGFYLLNQGNMDSNKASLDFYDYESGAYENGVFARANPDVVLGLGDVGNDMCLYGSKLYVVVNKSDKVEVLDASNGKRIKTVQIKNPRFITSSGGNVYVSSFSDQEEVGNTTKNGSVLKVDTTNLTVVGKVIVGRQPEGIAVVGDKLYVANSGSYDASDYERTLSVIALNTFTKTGEEIDVAINLKNVEADSRGNLYVSSLGDYVDYVDIPGKLYVVDPQQAKVTKVFDIPVSNYTIAGDTLYAISLVYDAQWNATYAYHMISTKTQQELSGSFIGEEDQEKMVNPYHVAVDAVSGNLFLTDALNYQVSGKVYCFDKNGRFQYEKTTGQVPCKIVFITENREKE